MAKSNRIDLAMRHCRDVIAEHGWAVAGVFPTETAPGPLFNYTVGLTEKGFPELFVAGLDLSLGHDVVNHLAEIVVDRGTRFTAGERVSGVIEIFDLVIVEGDATNDLRPAYANRLYGRHKVAIQQAVFPDAAGHYPWQLEYSIGPEVQPLLANASWAPEEL